MQLNKSRAITVIFVILLSFISLLPSYAVKQTGIPVMNEATTQELTANDNNVKVKDIDIDPLNTDSIKKSVVPDTKKEGKKLISLFIKTMLMVAFSATILYIILFFIKRFYGSNFVPSDEEYENAEMLELVTPETKTDALKSFLNRKK